MAGYSPWGRKEMDTTEATWLTCNALNVKVELELKVKTSCLYPHGSLPLKRENVMILLALHILVVWQF